MEELTDEIISEYLVYGSPKYNSMVEEMRKAMHLTSLRFQKLEKLLTAVGVPSEKLCTYCWNGKDVKKQTLF